MHTAVLEYDWTINRIETELLLLNIARTRYHEPIHFTAVSNIAATFDFRVNTGLAGLLAGAPGADSLSLTLGSSAAENPTVTIIPIQGKEFATRLLTPITEEAIFFLGQQGTDPAILFRLVSRGIILEDNGGRQRFLLNQPQRQRGIPGVPAAGDASVMAPVRAASVYRPASIHRRGPTEDRTDRDHQLRSEYAVRQ